MAISKVMNGSGFAGVLSYVSEKDQAEFIAKGGVFNDEAKAIAGEMRANADQRNLKTPVMHVALSLKPGEHATAEQWKIAAEAYLQHMGFDLDKSQYAVYRHNDRDHDHIHIVANRVMLDGQVVKDGQQYKRSHEATRQAEKAAGLSQLQKSDEKQNKGHVHRLRKALDGALEGGASLDQFRSRLATKGIQLQENRASTGRLAGLSFKDQDGRVWKGSALGKDYSLASLEKRGLETGNQQQQNQTKEVSQSPTASADRAISQAAAALAQAELMPTGMAGAGNSGGKSGGKSMMADNSKTQKFNDDEDEEKDDEYEYE